MIDDLEVTKALIETVTNWHKDKGMTELIGPIGFTDLDRMGMLVDGFEHLNMFITIWNPPYYMKHLELLGFVKDVDWIEKQIKLTSIPEKIEKVANITERRFGYRLLKLKKKKRCLQIYL